MALPVVSNSATTSIGSSVDSLVGIVQKNITYNSDRSTFSVAMALQNLSQQTIYGPLAIVVTSLCSPNTTLTNASGTDQQGHSYRTVTLLSNKLLPNARKTGITLSFQNPDRGVCDNTYTVNGFTAPTAIAVDQSKMIDSPVDLDGSASTDSAGLPLTYEWTLTNRPLGSSAKLTDAKSAVAHFTPDKIGTYKARLIVNNGIVNSDPLIVTIAAHSNGLVKLHVNAFDPKGHKLHYKWRVSEGTITDVDAPNTTYLLPPGPGVHFANVLVYNNAGGYTERRIALTSDNLGISPPAASSRPDFTPASPAGATHSDQAYVMAWSGAGRFVYLPDAKITSTDPAVSAISTTAYGLFRQNSEIFADLNNDDIALIFLDPNLEMTTVPMIYGGITLGKGYQPFRSSAPHIYGAQGSFIFGSAVMSDGSACGIDSPFFDISVTATATPLDNTGNALAAPVHVNRFGDYAVLYDSRVAAIQLQCENAPKITVPVRLDTATGSGIASRAVFVQSAPPKVRDNNPGGIVAKLDGKTFGKFLSPRLGAPSDKLKGGEQFLAYKGVDTAQSACAYYKAIGAVTDCETDGQPVGAITFDDWKRKAKMAPYIDSGAGVQEYTATYINQVDLNLTRRQHSIAYPATTGSPATVAAYVCNHLGPVSPRQADIDNAIANALDDLNLVACVAMDFGIGGDYVRFFGFAANGQLLTSINLDGRREKFVPGTCTVCHGGDHIRGKFAEDDTGSPDIGAHFLPYDVGNFAFSSTPGLQRQDQEEAIYQLNQNVLKAGPTESETDLINGWYKIGHTLDTHYVPQTWLDEASGDPQKMHYPKQRLGADLTKLYSQVNARYCRTCHIAMKTDGTQDTEDPGVWLDGDLNTETDRGRLDNDLDPVVCGGYPDIHRNHSMPNSLVTFNLFWNDANAKALLARAKGTPCLDLTSKTLADPAVQLPVVKKLVSGVSQTIKGGGGTLRHFPIDVPSGKKHLQVTSSGGSGDVNFRLYQGVPANLNNLGANETPVTASCDPNGFGTKRNCTYDLTASGAGNYYLVIEGQTVFKGVRLKAVLSP